MLSEPFDEARSDSFIRWSDLKNLNRHKNLIIIIFCLIEIPFVAVDGTLMANMAGPLSVDQQKTVARNLIATYQFQYQMIVFIKLITGTFHFDHISFTVYLLWLQIQKKKKVGVWIV